MCFQLLKYLKEGTLVEDYLLDHVPQLMSCLRECNVHLRWLVLHTAEGRKFIGLSVCLSLNLCCLPVVSMENRRCKFFREAVLGDKYDPLLLFRLLLNTGQFEYVLKEVQHSRTGQRNSTITRTAFRLYCVCRCLRRC